jgi:cytochrome c peroxidase
MNDFAPLYAAGRTICTTPPARWTIVCILAVALALSRPNDSRAATPVRPPEASGAVLRRPIAIVRAAKRYWIANRDSGSLVWMPEDDLQVAGEMVVGQRLSDLVALPHSDLLVVADEGARQLVLVRPTVDGAQIVDRQPIGGDPVSIAASHDGQQIDVALRWARRVGSFSLHPVGVPVRLQPRGHVDLPCAPGRLCMSPDGNRLFVADAFGPLLAVVDRQRLQVDNLVQIPGHNLRALAISPNGQELLIAHQMLNDFIPTTRDHVFWGNIVSNVLRTVRLDELRQAPAASIGGPRKVHGTLLPLGRESHAAGDPESIVINERGDLLVAIGGTGELAVRRRDARAFKRFTVGRRPTDIAIAGDQRHALVANRFDDALALVDLDEGSVLRSLPLGTLPPLSDAQRGEQLFYDANLSLHGWFSCHSCHTDGHTCGLLNDNFGDNSIGAPKRIPSLLGTRDTGPWAWNGSQPTLARQIEKSLRQTMHAAETHTIDPEQVRALDAYLQSLPPAPALRDVRRQLDPTATERGRKLFATLDCVACHRPPVYTSPAVYDVGLHDERGATEFNPPSLRGVSQRPALLHDNRCRSLAELLQVHPDARGTRLAADDQRDLITFLESLLVGWVERPKAALTHHNPRRKHRPRSSCRHHMSPTA